MKLVLAAFIALDLAPMAHGQATCADYQKIIAEASTHFEALRGDQIQPGIFYAKTALPGFPSCGVVQKGEAAYTCYRPVISEAQGLVQYKKEVEVIRSCVPGWEQKPLDPRNRLPSDPVPLVSTQFIKKTDAGYISIGAIVAVQKAGARSVRVMGIGVKLNPLSSPLS
jgi:hypothetical protein